MSGEFTVLIKTGDLKWSGTDNTVYIKLIDHEGNESPDQQLDNRFHDDFERGQEDTFHLKGLSNLGNIQTIRLWRTGLISDDWFVDHVTVENHAAGMRHVFPVHRWVPHREPLEITEYDSVLPQDDPNSHTRKAELDRSRVKYMMRPKHPGLPPQIVDFPDEESFSDEYQWDINKKKLKLLAKSKIKSWLTGRWKSLDDVKELYGGKSFPTPASLEQDWKSDEYFGRQRLQGCNPNQFHLIQTIPENFAVTGDLVKPFLEGQTLDEALAENRIFLVDHAILEGLEKTDKDIVLCAPMALFYRGKTGSFKPIAIQLHQKPSNDNPVFIPSDPPYTWLIAKMWFNNADASIHESSTHLGMTHLLMETVVITTHRHLSPSHPLFRLLAPHFLYLIAINTRALGKLVSPGGWVDNTMSIGRLGMFDIVRRKFAKFRINRDGILPKELESRGVLDEQVLPEYPYRDDALLLWYAIRKYATTAVKGYYESEDKIKGDWELQCFVKELATPLDKGGAGFQGVPGGGESISSYDDLIDIINWIIYTCSVAHAAVNFNQYDDYAFPPSYPAMMQGKPPANKKILSETNILASLPNKSQTLDVMIVTKILSDRGTQSLGDFEVPYAFDPAGLGALEQFKKDLEEAEEKMKERNKNRPVPYTILHPSEVPNAISI